jgi:hypothetical protein
MNAKALGYGNTKDFLLNEFETLALGDQRLNKRALIIFEALQKKLTSCIRRLFTSPKEARQAYDFF